MFVAVVCASLCLVTYSSHTICQDILSIRLPRNLVVTNATKVKVQVLRVSTLLEKTTDMTDQVIDKV
jgi:hypothetical protein